MFIGAGFAGPETVRTHMMIGALFAVEIGGASDFNLAFSTLLKFWFLLGNGRIGLLVLLLEPHASRTSDCSLWYHPFMVSFDVQVE
jgi:hypothetical protein